MVTHKKKAGKLIEQYVTLDLYGKGKRKNI